MLEIKAPRSDSRCLAHGALEASHVVTARVAREKHGAKRVRLRSTRRPQRPGRSPWLRRWDEDGWHFSVSAKSTVQSTFTLERSRGDFPLVDCKVHYGINIVLFWRDNAVISRLKPSSDQDCMSVQEAARRVEVLSRSILMVSVLTTPTEKTKKEQSFRDG